MRGGRPGLVHEPLRTLFGAGTAAGLTDAQLLERFVSPRGDDAEAAFAALVSRHGPMVRRICRSLLADANDADDVFQATFLVLAQRPGRSGGRNCWATGSTGRHIARPGRSGLGPHVGSNTRRGRRPWHTCGPRPIADGIERQAVRARRCRSSTRRSPGCPKPCGRLWCYANWRGGPRRR